jgi:hypothetical protein
MRALIATLLLVFGCIVCTVDAVGIYTSGSIPTFTTSAVDGVGIISTVSREAEAQGLRVGDRYRYEANWPVLRATEGWSTRGALPPNVDVPVAIERDGRRLEIHLRTAAATPAHRVAMLLDVAFKLLGTLIGVLLVARGRDAFGLYAGIAIAGMSTTSGFISGLYLGSSRVTEIVDAMIVILALFARYFLIEAMLTICSLRRAEAAVIRTTATAASIFLVGLNLSIVYANRSIRSMRSRSMMTAAISYTGRRPRYCDLARCLTMSCMAAVLDTKSSRPLLFECLSDLGVVKGER